MSCWQVLELAPGSDARSIKRRYAELLKVSRPDEDPVAFQRLREAYEQAIASARRGTAEPLGAFVVSEVAPPAAPPISVEPAFETSNVPLVQPMGDDHQWLHETLERLDADQLDTYLAQARARNCQVLFEQRLLDCCLSDRDDAPQLIEWALTTLQWLTPWQASPLSTSRLERLAARLLEWHLDALSLLLAQGEEAQAQACVQRFYRQPWMQAVDRSAAYTLALVDWMVDNEDANPDFFALVCKVFGWSDGIEGWPIPAWQRQVLSTRPDPRRFSKRISQLLAASEPRNTDESAAWMLFQKLDVRERRILADSFIELDWVACEQMQRIFNSEPPEALDALEEASDFDWQRYRHGHRWSGAYVWLVVFCVLTFSLVTSLSQPLQGSGSVIGRFIESAMSGVFAALIVGGVHGAWNWLARQFTGTDIALAQRYWPKQIHCAGAGLLPLRNGVPCIALGIFAGALVANRTSLSALDVIPLALVGMLLPAAYVLLQFFRPTLNVPNFARWWRANIEGLLANTIMVGGLIGLALLLWFSKFH